MSRFFDTKITCEFALWVSKYYFYSNPGFVLKALPELEQTEQTIEELLEIFISDLKGFEND